MCNDSNDMKLLGFFQHTFSAFADALNSYFKLYNVAKELVSKERNCGKRYAHLFTLFIG